MTAEQQPSGPSRDWWIWADLLVGLGLATAAGTCLSFDIHGVALWIVLAAIPAILAYLAGCAVACTHWSAKRQWGRAGASATKAVAFILLLVPCVRAGDDVHLAMLYPIYRHEIEAQAGAGDVPIRFDWGNQAWTFLDGYQHETLVYDPTDRLAEAIDDIRPTDRGGFAIATRHLVGHFYVETEFSE